jgi:urea carboxylase
LREYHEFLQSIESTAADFKRIQHDAFVAERERWALTDAERLPESPGPTGFDSGAEPWVPEGCSAVRSPTTASVWKISVEPGQRVAAGERVLVLEAMKMEIAVTAPCAGVIHTVNCVKGALVTAGQNLVTLHQEVGLEPGYRQPASAL